MEATILEGEAAAIEIVSVSVHWSIWASDVMIPRIL